MAKEDKLNVIDKTDGAPQSDFLVGINSFVKYQSKEISCKKDKALLIVADDSESNQISCSVIGHYSTLIEDIVELMESENSVRNIILEAAFAYLHVPDSVRQLLSKLPAAYKKHINNN